MYSLLVGGNRSCCCSCRCSCSCSSWTCLLLLLLEFLPELACSLDFSWLAFLGKSNTLYLNVLDTGNDMISQTILTCHVSSREPETTFYHLFFFLTLDYHSNQIPSVIRGTVDPTTHTSLHMALKWGISTKITRYICSSNH